MTAWRVGSHYGIHIYDGDTPVATALTPDYAAQIVADHNINEDEERELVETALGAADAGNAGHWPTVAAYLAAEVRRLRALLVHLGGGVR